MTETLATLVRPALLLALAAAAVSAVAAPAPKPMTVYVGTYTDGTSRGIYRMTFDPSAGSLTEPVLAAETKNPSFLALLLSALCSLLSTRCRLTWPVLRPRHPGGAGPGRR